METAVKALDGAEGYLRWKESMLLRLHTANVAYVLSEDQPAGEDAERSAKKWARDDAVCRGHILDALSDRIFPDYVRHATARAVWQAVARTYELDMRGAAQHGFFNFEFDHGAPLLEQIAHAEALAAQARIGDDDGFVAHELCTKLPEKVATPASLAPENNMSGVWRVARIIERLRVERELKGVKDDEEEGTDIDSAEQEENRECWNCRMPGHIARNCTEKKRKCAA